jgi:outer membrane protein TolC
MGVRRWIQAYASMSHRFIVSFLLFPASLLSLGLARENTKREETLSLTEATGQALQNNSTLKAARAKWEAANQRVLQAAAWDDPKLSVNSLLGRFADISRNGFMDQAVTVEQMIPLSGKNRSKERIAAAEAVSSFEDFRREQLDITAKTKATYYRLANIYSLLDLNSQQETALAQTLDATKAKFEVGTQSQADYLTAQIERQKIIETRRDLEEKLSEEQSGLNVLMNKDAFSPLPRPALDEMPAYDLSGPRLRGLVLVSRPEIRRAQSMVVEAAAKAQLAKRAWIPDPAVSLQAQHYNAGRQAIGELNAGVSINVPWFNWEKYRAGEREAQSEVLAAQKTLETAQKEALAALRDQLQKIETMHHHTELYRNQLLPSARQTVSAYQSDYETNKATLVQILTAENNLRELETMYNQALTDYRIAIAELEALVGSDLHKPVLGFESSRQATK